MVHVPKVKPEDLDVARYESKKPIEVSDRDTRNGMSSIVTILRLALIRTINIAGDIHPEWVSAMVLFNHLTCKAPIASLTGNNEHRKIDDRAFKRDADKGDGHTELISAYEHGDFPDGDGHTYRDLADLNGMAQVFGLMSIVLRRLLGLQGPLCDLIANMPKES